MEHDAVSCYNFVHLLELNYLFKKYCYPRNDYISPYLSQHTFIPISKLLLMCIICMGIEYMQK